jgi:hypothetical protein
MTMNYVAVDDSLQEQLSGVVETIEIRDASGKVLGHFTPMLSPEEAEFYARAHEFFDPEELDRREQETKEGKVHTTEEVLQYLRSLKQPG